MADIAIAYDVSSLEAALALDDRLGKGPELAKVGLELFTAAGPDVVRALTARGRRVFLDLKLHDIPNTVELAARRCAEMAVSYFTVHAQGGAAMLRAARSGALQGAAQRGLNPPKLLAVNVLTSLSDKDLRATGHASSPVELTLQLAQLALDCGADGLVCSAQEVARLRSVFGSQPLLCTPGIRFAADAQGDQQRVATPQEAVRSGADLLVVGRPVYAAADPLEAARRLWTAVSDT